jgi:hypothetical protein
VAHGLVLQQAVLWPAAFADPRGQSTSAAARADDCHLRWSGVPSGLTSLRRSESSIAVAYHFGKRARGRRAVLGGLSTLKPQAGSVRELKHPHEPAGSVLLLRTTANVGLSRKQTLVLLVRVVSGSATTAET